MQEVVSDLIPGDMAVLWQRREEKPIKARKRPERLGVLHRDEDGEYIEDNVICNIPAGALVLYMSSYNDGLSEAIAKKGRGPYGMAPKKVTFHLVLWGESPVWVSSEDAELRKA